MGINGKPLLGVAEKVKKRQRNTEGACPSLSENTAACKLCYVGSLSTFFHEKVPSLPPSLEAMRSHFPLCFLQSSLRRFSGEKKKKRVISATRLPHLVLERPIAPSTGFKANRASTRSCKVVPVTCVIHSNTAEHAKSSAACTRQQSGPHQFTEPFHDILVLLDKVCVRMHLLRSIK